MTKFKKIMISLITATLLILAGCGSSAVVKTDAGNITQDDLYEAMKTTYGNEVVQQLTFEKILEDKYTVTEKEVNAEYKKYEEQYGDSFESTLASSNLTKTSFKENIKYNLLVQKATEANMDVSDSTLKKYYKTWQPDITVRHILVDDEATAKEVQTKLKNGEKFTDLAKEYSTDTATSTNGGLLDPFGTGEMDEAFEKAAYALEKTDDVSGIVKTSYGYHLIQLVKKTDKTTYAKDKAKVKEAYIQSQLTSENMTAALKKELKDANIDIKDSDLKDAFSDYTSTESTSTTTSN
ncbi:peptidylprolyl isomerase PrsA [Listeria seeligeri]|uniref:peptidylprolyl isomerase n=1 Tax=Listeria seeligeri TaxID=1640 RepID=UPI0016278DA9|nr:peptidylprolyl isomerase [Listeria seeligeri]MBC1579381.1 peptidylprolyl isomerase PrsA [Listeria seeligeri]MBC1595192.1 peptidylprolyl isomerase PrsA [Listeria seeligeri]MBC1597904.1 peptidylprolyl isomerase PrsA [Listeria seeligeri]MBC2043823.1 peptidylprolyl isomerase PrsA [Listeria seeligeri]MBC2049708.1 peptidylprolyl isomerase PrsA [Listeria seeligeri]